MRIETYESLEKAQELFIAGWFTNIFIIEKLTKIKENEKSIKFKVITEQYKAIVEKDNI